MTSWPIEHWESRFLPWINLTQESLRLGKNSIFSKMLLFAVSSSPCRNESVENDKNNSDKIFLSRAENMSAEKNESPQKDLSNYLCFITKRLQL